MLVADVKNILREIQLDALEPFWNCVDPAAFIHDGVRYRACVHEGKIVECEMPEVGSMLAGPSIQRVIVLNPCESAYKVQGTALEGYLPEMIVLLLFRPSS